MIDTSARLIAVTYTGAMGLAQRTETETPILCTLDRANRAEYYAAYNSGFRPEYRVETEPANYSGQRWIELDTSEGPVRCDVYRTYRKSQDVLELWCSRLNPEADKPVTLWTGGKRVVLYGAYLSGSDGVERTQTGRVATDAVTLILPQTLQAFVGEQQVEYCRPKAYARMTEEQKAARFTIDSRDFFGLGLLDTALVFAPEGTDGVLTSDGYLLAGSDLQTGEKYQTVNGLFDDVYLVQSVALRNRGKPGTEYLEVVGR